MSITDELRKEALSFKNSHGAWSSIGEKLDHVADRIDAAHEEALVSSYFDGVFSDGELAENDFMRLPRSIEDKPINEHDKVDWRDHAGTWHENVTVVAVCNDGCYVMDGTVFHVHKSDIRHRHAPTVEDVLMEFHERMDELGTTDQCVGSERADAVDALLRERAELVAEYAAKLRLAGDAE